ncbi:hypothetical protein UFOVP75_210 [uncultured Caudovirales phage]|uniref:Uncharacterized protein n=1 Tax=uncultured Caudovirales phage TaxID=2100421 RepID=A0A6J5L1F1_9CAUD|nr:hypothetical protein UFOVP75_210 [uncultured Caudovirales phage]
MTAPQKKPDVKRMARMLDSFCRRYGKDKVEFALYCYLARGFKGDETFEWDEEACLKKGLYSMARWCRLMRLTSHTQRGLIEYGFFNHTSNTRLVGP